MAGYLTELSKAAVAAHISTLFQPSPEDPSPPELAQILQAVADLPEGFYLVLDAEEMELPAWLQALPSHRILEWDGRAEQSLGYGWVNSVQTSHGLGLDVACGGSSLASATGLYVFPTAMLQYLAEE